MSERRSAERWLTMMPLIAFLAIWQIVGSSSSRMEFLYATPTRIASTLVAELQRAEFWADMGVTAAEVVGGLVLGNCLGTIAALLLWLLPSIGRISRPYIVAIGSIPVFAIMPVFILWFGIAFGGKLAIIVFSTAFVSLAYSFAAAVEVGTRYDEVIACIGGSRSDLLKKIVLPGIISRSFVAYRINVSFALIGAYVAEWGSARRGLGQFILRPTSLYDVPRVWAGLIMFLTLAFALYALTSLIERLAVAGPDSPRSRPLW